MKESNEAPGRSNHVILSIIVLVIFSSGVSHGSGEIVILYLAFSDEGSQWVIQHDEGSR